MSAPRPLEEELLAATDAALARLVAKQRDKGEARFQLLEAAAARLGGFSLTKYQAMFGIESSQPVGEAIDSASIIVESIGRAGIPPPLALSALAREQLTSADRRATGAYHTDFRLAQRLADLALQKTSNKPTLRVIDPACGAGMLLAAVAVRACGSDRRRASRFLAENVHAADRAPVALRGALLALASLTSDLGALRAMHAKWKVTDSLMDERQWSSVAPDGFDLVIGNPPWEKVKLSRHEFLKAEGDVRHYGSDVREIDHKRYSEERLKVARYADALAARYPALRGEPDLYIAFMQLFQKLSAPNGVIAVLVPAGLIRSKGTELIRRQLFERSSELSFSVFENRARFFSIDTRFKFLAVVAKGVGAGAKVRPSFELLHERGNDTSTEQIGRALINRKDLAAIRPDLSVPEVRSITEWRIFHSMVAKRPLPNRPGSDWVLDFCREIDMTRDRANFRHDCADGRTPLVEGRMVHLHRLGAKGYLSGSGRSALWKTLPIGRARVEPQFWLDGAALPAAVKRRSEALRAGFCDITGQTNERSMMAALIPPGVVCGNKVPTVLFEGGNAEDRLFAWCAVVNSLPFDWLMRRVVTTTVNYFLLLSLPIPTFKVGGLPWQRLVKAARELRALDHSGSSARTSTAFGELRCSIDVDVAIAYGLGFPDLLTVLQDFPLLDRGQPALPSEVRSTITRDTLLAAAAVRFKMSNKEWADRAERARKLGALPYMPSEYACEDHDVEASHG